MIVGLIWGVTGLLYFAEGVYGRRYATSWKREGLSVDFRTWTRAAAIRDAGERLAWTVVDPWPGVVAGAGVTALGIIVLAIRRPERKPEETL
jgi:hypothetical protein